MSTTFSPKSLALGVSGLQLPDGQPVGERACKKNNRREFKTRNVEPCDAQSRKLRPVGP